MSARTIAPESLSAAHRHSINHRQGIEQSNRCGCFHCKKTFAVQDIVEWTDDGQTHFAEMWIDSVIGDKGVAPQPIVRLFAADARQWLELKLR